MGGLCSAPFLCSPGGPGTPFAGWLALWDGLRLLTITVAAAVAVATPAVARQSHDRWQSRRFISVALFAIVAAQTEIQHLGDWPSIRLVLNLAASLYMLSGYLGMWRQAHHRTEGGQP